MHETLLDRDIAVVGIGCRFPHAPDVNSLWSLVRRGEIAFEDLSDQRWQQRSFYSSDVRAVDKTYAVRGAFIEGIDQFAALHFGIAPRRLQVTDPQHRLLVEIVREALQDAGYDKRPFDRRNTGVFVGASVSEYKDLLTSRLRAESIADGSYGESLPPAAVDALRSAVADVVPVRTFTIAGSLLNMMAATVSQVFDLSGPSFTLDAACSSALVAIHEAVVHLRAGQCNLALAGGAYLNLTPDNLVGFARLQAISQTGECRPFDARADGFVMGEGVGVVVLKRITDARRDGDRIYAVIRGSGCNNDGHGTGPMTPNAEGQIDAMDRAHRDAGVFPVETIQYAETHGAATSVGDAVEVEALKRFFNSRAGHELTRPFCYIGSIKANIGHTMAAAGVAGFIKAALSVYHGVVPPQPSVEMPNPKLGLERSPFLLAPLALPWRNSSQHPRRAAVSSFGFGGTNVHILLEQAMHSAPALPEREELFVISAPTPALLSKHLLEIAAVIEDQPIVPASVAYTLAARATFDSKVAFTAKGAAELLCKLRNLALEVSAADGGNAGMVGIWSGGRATDDASSAARESVGRAFVSGAVVDWVEMMRAPDHVLGTLPPTPLIRERYWAIERSETAVVTSPPKVVVPIAEVTPLRRDLPRRFFESKTRSREPHRVSHERLILDSVARISAFPEETIHVGQQLTDDLGFDSLMLVDLAEDIGMLWPEIEGVPYDSLTSEMRVQDVVDFVLARLPADAGRDTPPADILDFAHQEPAQHGGDQHCTVVPISRFSHAYLDSHVIAGQRVLPFAVAMDYVAAAALDAIGEGATVAFSITGFRAVRPVVVPGTTWLQLMTYRAPHERIESKVSVTLSQDNTVCYRGKIHVSNRPLDSFTAVAPSAVPLSVREFYDRATFQGPVLQGIVSIEGVDESGITGTVNVSKPGDWISQSGKNTWTIDPLAIDCGFQLAAYWIWIRHGRSAFPLSFDEYVQFRPFGSDPVHCTARVEAIVDNKFRGSLAWHDIHGRLFAIMNGIVAEAKDQGFRLLFGSEAAAPGPQAAAPRAFETRAASRYEIKKFPEYEGLKAQLKLAEELGVSNPYFRIPKASGGGNDSLEIDFSSYNYVNNSGNPLVSAAAKAAIERYGTSVSASRVASGERPLHAELEHALAAFLGTEACLVFTSGHATNVTVIGHIIGAEDLILHDELAHDSIIQGAKLSGAKRRSFAHNDVAGMDRTLARLREHYRRVLICIEGAYSMDGDIPDLHRFIEVKKRHQALLFVDEAHSIGVIGQTGRGIGEYCDVARDDVDIWMGTLSKSFASCGGYICGSHELIEYLKYTTPGFVYSVGMSPPNAAAALAALNEIVNHPERVQRVQRQAAKFLELLKSRGIKTGLSKDTAIVPAIIGDSALCLRLADSLRLRGVNVQPIMYPAVAESSARLRFFITSEHSHDQLTTAATILAEELERLTPFRGGAARNT